MRNGHVRLTEPLVRENGALRTATWSEALDRAAAGLRAARETHTIFFHHVLKGIHNGAKLYAVDPRRTSSAEWADLWLGLDVGSDIALANAIGREIIANDLHNTTFIENATTGFDDYAATV